MNRKTAAEKIKILREALQYAEHQANRKNQLRGIEDDTYFAWIRERALAALKATR